MSVQNYGNWCHIIGRHILILCQYIFHHPNHIINRDKSPCGRATYRKLQPMEFNVSPKYPISDNDECDEGTDDCALIGATCTNIDHSFECTCNDGYSGNGTHCEGKKVF